jgi:hypothetical protein
MSENPVRECKYFKLGKCFRGDSCFFLHSVSTEGEESSELVDIGFMIDRNGAEEPVVIKPVQEKNRHLKRVREPQDEFKSVPASSDAICKYFMRGKCFRDNCKFRHDFNFNEVITANTDEITQKTDTSPSVDLIFDPDASEDVTTTVVDFSHDKNIEKEVEAPTNIKSTVDANSILMKYSTSKMTHYKRNANNRR